MKILTLLAFSVLFVSCASSHQDRKVASHEEQEKLYTLEEKGDFGPGYRN